MSTQTQADHPGPGWRVCVLSDTHLSPVHGFFYENFRVVAKAIRGMDPELVINTGDMALDGAGSAEDLRFAAAAHRHWLPATTRVVPGNHDIGDTPADGASASQPIGAERIARFEAAFGRGYWSEARNGWRLIGLDTQVLGSGTLREVEQWAWLETVLPGQSSGIHLGLFMHKPLFIDAPDEVVDASVRVPAEARDRLMRLLEGRNLRFIVTGHLHQHRIRAFGGVQHIWMPATSFMSTMLKGNEVDARLGFLALTLEEGGGFWLQLFRPDGLQQRDLDTVKGKGRYRWIREMPPSPPDAAEIGYPRPGSD